MALIGMKRVLDSTSETFVTDFGIRFRRKAFKSIQKLLAPTIGKKIVVEHYPELDTIYGNYGEPMDFTGMDRDEAMELLRDTLATMHYEQIEKYGGDLKHSEREGWDYRRDFMMQRRAEYMKMHFTRDVWDEELPTYHPHDITEPQTVREELSRVKITPANAHILAPILIRHEEDVKYDFKRFMHETWNKKLPGDPEKW